MNILKKNTKPTLLFLIVNFISILILSSIYYLFGFSKDIYLPILFFINLTIIYIFNLKIGKSRKNESLINNLVFSITIICILFILSMIFFIGEFSFQNILYYIIIFTTSLLGLLIGRRKKLQN